jgi:DNA polymerase-3 subunit gamma/tau
VQALLEQAVYKPVQGRFKVFMIDEVHMLTNTAFNAMLKTLEEPPAYLKFVLATTDPQKVPVTVLSRCLQFNLRPMAPETIREHLVQVLQLENVNAEVQALRLLARAARGSMRDALSLTDQAIAFGNGQLQEAAVRQMLGSVDRSYVFRLIEALATGDGRLVVETSETLRVNGLSAASTLEEMSTVLQRMAVLQAAGPVAGDESDPEAADLSRLADLMPVDETQLLYSICLHGRADLGLAPDEYAALTMVLLRLLAFKPSAEKKTLTHAEPRVAVPAARAVAATSVPRPAVAAAPKPRAVQPWEDEPPPAPTSTASASAPASVTAPTPAPLTPAPAVAREAVHPPQPVAPHDGLPAGQMLSVLDSDPHADEVANDDEEPAPEPMRLAAPITRVLAMPVRQQSEPRVDMALSAAAPVLIPDAEGDFWFATVQQLVAAEAITAMVRELALQSQLVARDTDQWLLRVERETLNQPGSRERLSTALRNAGFDVKLAVEIGRVTDCPARRNAAASQEKQRAAEKIILDDPFVQAMMRDFDAKIVPGSIKPL